MALSGFSPWAAFLVAAQASTVWAQEAVRESGLPSVTAAGTAQTTPSPGSGGTLDLFGSGGVLRGLEYGVVFLLVLVAAAILFYRGNGLGGGGRGTRKLHVEETRGLGQRQFLAVVEYEGRKMLLGVCPGRIDYLCPLEDRGGGGEDFQSIQSLVAAVDSSPPSMAPRAASRAAARTEPEPAPGKTEGREALS
jgi:flagellar biogenesis protein FliO